MSNVIFFSYPFYSHINFSLKIAKALTERGEEVYFYSSEKYRDLIESRGVKFCAYGYADDLFQPDFQQLNGLEAMYGLAATTLEAGQRIIARNMREIERLCPDLVVYDSYAYWGRMVADRLCIPAISSITSYAFHEQLLEVRTEQFVRNILHMETESWITDNNWKLLNRMLEIYSAKLRKQYGLRDYFITDTFFGKGEMNLVYTSRYFQTDEELFDASYVFTGPIMDDSDLQSELPDLEGKKIIYISLGSIIHDKDFYQKCFMAFANAEFQVFMSTGAVSRSELGVIPENFVVGNFLPQIAILRNASLFITHGGANSVREALYFGVPLIVIPHATDEYMVAEDVERYGAGVYVRPPLARIDLYSLANQVLADASFCENAKIIATSFVNAGGLSHAVEAILNFRG